MAQPQGNAFPQLTSQLSILQAMRLDAVKSSVVIIFAFGHQQSLSEQADTQRC